MLCILCLNLYQDEFIHIFEKQGLDLNISNVITKHFWLQPSEDVPNCKVICSSCWSALDSFHKFYQKVEQAHLTLSNVVRLENCLKVETLSEVFNVCPDVLLSAEISDIKTEISDDSKVVQQGFGEERPFDPLEAVACSKVQTDEDIKSESESEIPLSKLGEYQKSDKVKRTSKKTKTVSKKKKQKHKEHEDNDNDEVAYEEWPTSSYADEINHNIGPQHYDGLVRFNIKLSCTICQCPMINFSVLREHYRTEHNESGYVACCDKKFNKRSSLVEHILLHKYPEYFKCDECGRILACRKNLKEHKKGHDKKLLFQCDSCPKSFHRKLLLDRHKDIHVSETERTFQCKDCNKFFASKFSLGQHTFGVHKGGYTKMCDQCGKVIRDLEAFRRHQLMHTNEPKPFVKCEKCGINLSTKAALYRHKRAKHAENDATHVCNICGTITANIYALKRHITYMHKYERTFKCTMCDKGFKRAIVLKEHMSTHTGEVLYTCPHCPKTFNSNANMHSHRKKMHRKEWEENRRHPHMAAGSNAD